MGSYLGPYRISIRPTWGGLRFTNTEAWIRGLGPDLGPYQFIPLGVGVLSMGTTSNMVYNGYIRIFRLGVHTKVESPVISSC